MLPQRTCKRVADLGCGFTTEHPIFMAAAAHTDRR
jgi:hypothetical protein